MSLGTILYVGNFELPDKNAAAHRVRNNGKLFQALGYRVAYLGAVRGESFSGIRPSSYDEDVYEEAYPLGMKQWIQHIFDTDHLKQAAAHYADLRLILVYNLPYATLRAIQKAFAGSGVKVAYDCTEWNAYAEGALPKRLYKKWDEIRIRRGLARRCRDLIVISRRMEEQYRGANLLRLPPLVDLEDAIWHQEPEQDPNVFEFCFAGTTGNKERLDTVVSAFSETENPSFRLRIIGTQKEEYLSAFPEHESLLAKEDRIHFMGRLSHQDTVKRVLGCGCYVFLREETRRNQAGFPTKFAEAMTCGVSVLSTSVSDIRDYADERVVLLERSDRAAVISAMEAMASGASGLGERRCCFDYRQYQEAAAAWLADVLQ